VRTIVNRLLIVIAASVLFGTGAFAQPSAYARKTTTIRVGILLIDSTAGPGGQPTNADPYVFYNLERRNDLKPSGWEFENPLASGTITPDMQARWDAIYAGLGLGPGPFVAGQKLGKNMAPYWEVYLSRISTTTLGQFDVLMIHAPTGIALNSLDREKLRNFIDAGGILWFDKSAANAVDGFNPLPVPFAVSPAGTNPTVVQPDHPLFNYPHKISQFEAAFIGAHNGGHAIIRQTIASIGLTGRENIIATMSPDYYRMNALAVNTAGITIGVAPVGNGYFVATAGNITSRINEPAGGTTLGGLGLNSGPIAGESFYNIPARELKFAYNMMALAAGHQALAKGSRRTNASFDDLGAPMLETWSDTSLNLGTGNDTNYFPPAIYKGLVFITAGNTLTLTRRTRAATSTATDGPTTDSRTPAKARRAISFG
jgi:hypothetical protein